MKSLELIDIGATFLIISSCDKSLGFNDLSAPSSRFQQPQEAAPVTIEEEEEHEEHENMMIVKFLWVSLLSPEPCHKNIQSIVWMRWSKIQTALSKVTTFMWLWCRIIVDACLANCKSWNAVSLCPWATWTCHAWHCSPEDWASATYCRNADNLQGRREQNLVWILHRPLNNINNKTENKLLRDYQRHKVALLNFGNQWSVSHRDPHARWNENRKIESNRVWNKNGIWECQSQRNQCCVLPERELSPMTNAWRMITICSTYTGSVFSE